MLAILRFIIFIFSFNVFALAQAETLLIANTPIAFAHTGPTDQDPIAYKFTEGTPVEVIQKDQKNGFALVRTEKAEQGWVSLQYLDDEQENNDSNFTQAINKLNSQFQALKNKLIQDELKLAALPTISAEHGNEDSNTADINQLQQQLSLLKHENMELRGAFTIRWFLSGAGILLIGMLLGILIAKLNHKRRLFD